MGGKKKVQNAQSKLVKELEDELTANAQGLFSICMPIMYRGDFNRQAHNKHVLDEKSTPNYHFIRFGEKSTAIDMLLQYGDKFEMRPDTNKTRNIPGERPMGKSQSKDDGIKSQA